MTRRPFTEEQADSKELQAKVEMFISERALHLPRRSPEEIDIIWKQLFDGIASWAAKRRSRDAPPTERLLSRWVPRHLSALEAAYKDFRDFFVAESPSHPEWGTMHFIGYWFVIRKNSVATEIVSLFEVLVSKAVEEQEREILPDVKAVVQRVRSLEKAAAALKSEIERLTTSGAGTFWSGLNERIGGAVGEVLGPNAANAAFEVMRSRGWPDLPGPFLALRRLRPGWDHAFSLTKALGETTLSELQANFSSSTIGAAHAPEKKGARFRIGELERAGFSQREIADFEDMTVGAVAEQLRRARRSTKGT
jgi:hypothetical protein